jgi:glycosyltransferase involved in cell wall biosynthesis
MRGHDLVSAHDRIVGHAAAFAGKQLHIPSFITWHGASIYTDPPRDPMIKELTIKLLHSVTCNFFVSQGLLDKAHAELTDGFPAEVLLNGASAQFCRYSDERRAQLREKYGANDGKKVVAFIGRFEPVKNVTLLPDIYKMLEDKYGKELTFWAIGDGIQLDETRRLMAEKGVKCHFTGKVPPEEIPDLLNCVDLLVLPSSLEGLPLVVIEALSCGAHVVATNVIGTAEAVGRENAIDLGDNFIERFTDRGAQLLMGDIDQQLPPEVSWTATAAKENSIYQSYLNQ